MTHAFTGRATPRSANQGAKRRYSSGLGQTPWVKAPPNNCLESAFSELYPWPRDRETGKRAVRPFLSGALG
jgi:hypothetical protein